MGTLKSTIRENEKGPSGPYVTPYSGPRTFGEATVSELTAHVLEQVKASIRAFQLSHPKMVPELVVQPIEVDGEQIGKIEVQIYRRWDLHLGAGGEIGGDLAESMRGQIRPQIEAIKTRFHAKGD